jgi:1-acyl-sn-glycerol-3-phosphate acyltransferase
LERHLRTPFALRVARGVRVTIHFLRGVMTTVLVFPRIGQEERHALIRRWSGRLLELLRIEARLDGVSVDELPGNLLVVANHVSWIDIFVLNSMRPARFIAKAELKRWPLAGRLISNCGTLFLERERRRDAHRVNEQARDALAAGATIAIFPEGTTTDGTSVLPFHASLLQPIIDARGHVQPVAIRYRKADGAYSEAPAYVGETTFLGSFWRVLGERRMLVRVTLGPTLRAEARHRRELSRDAEAFIRTALLAPERGSGPETRDDRRPESR